MLEIITNLLSSTLVSSRPIFPGHPAITGLCCNGRTRAVLLSFDFFGSLSWRHSALASCGGFQPAARPSLSACPALTPPGDNLH
ncbi:hypothetical protein ACFLTX_01960 [Chloroflexota bacterium]